MTRAPSPRPKRSVAAAPDFQSMEIGFLLKQAAKHQQVRAFNKAVPLYQKVLRLDPKHPHALHMMGRMAHQTGHNDVAVGLISSSLAVRPDNPRALVDLGNALKAAGRPKNAVDAYDKAIRLDPDDPAAFANLGAALLALGRRDEAVAAFRRTVELDPAHKMAAHMVASLTGEGADEAMRVYAKELFDSYAGIFEQHLVTTLNYDTPKAMRGLIEALPDAPRAIGAVLDLGCGTGLVAQAFAGAYAAIDGVDIAPKMVEQARTKGLYRRLEAADLIAFLADSAPAAYDLVVAADVCIYLGRLEALFAGVADVIRPGGLFTFSVESSETDDVQLRPTGRFAHAAGYIAGLAEGSGLAIVSDTPTDLRKDHGVSIAGRIYVLKAA